jgi:hypothetical protein
MPDSTGGTRSSTGCADHDNHSASFGSNIADTSTNDHGLSCGPYNMQEPRGKYENTAADLSNAPTTAEVF